MVPYFVSLCKRLSRGAERLVLRTIVALVVSHQNELRQNDETQCDFSSGLAFLIDTVVNEN